MILLFLLLGLGVTALEAWLVMLLLGVIHSNVPEVPSFNYVGTLFAILLINVVVGGVSRATKKG